MSESMMVGAPLEVEEDQKPPIIVEKEKPPKKPGKEKPKRRERIRFEWLDQFRGIVIVLFIVQTFAYAFSGNPSGGILPILPPMVNHGYKYINFGDGIPKIITLVDIGQQIFIFLVGFMQAFAVMKRKQKSEEKWRVWTHTGIRVAGIFALSILHVLIEFFLDGPPFDFEKAFLTGTLANIAWAGLFAALISILMQNGNIRFWTGFGLMIITETLWYVTSTHGGLAPLFTSNLLDTLLPLVGHIEIGIIAAGVAGWIFKPDGTIKEEGWKKQVLPLAIGFMVLSYLSWFINWADHHKVNMSLATMAIGFSSLMIFTFYAMGQRNFKIPLLTPLGKNMLLVFLLSMIINEVIYKDMILISFNLIGLPTWYGPLLDMLLVGIIPTILMWAIVWPLDKFNIIIKI
ncbi:MAG: hypothetical protein JW776_13795 [Candidatus Lokiarchaeota archaeon]|nr:hypothetical protein [Candidatus Lokiarchaeota archaeon]